MKYLKNEDNLKNENDLKKIIFDDLSPQHPLDN